MEQNPVVERADVENKRADLGFQLSLEVTDKWNPKAHLYHHDLLIKSALLSDKAAKRLFIVEAVELGAIKSRLASSLNMSRQSIDNYIEIKKHFGLEGLIHSYSPSKSKNLRVHRQQNADKRIRGNKAQQVAKGRKGDQECPSGEDSTGLKQRLKDQKDQAGSSLFAEEHAWEATRYGGIFVYLMMLISQWKWLALIVRYFGDKYEIFMVFMLMAARNIRSIEQLKHVRVREAGIVLGLKQLPAKSKIWSEFYLAASQRVSRPLLNEYFRDQIRRGLVGLWLWFTDGHLLPYTGKQRVHSAYHTQRRLPMPGQTNLVTCDSQGCIVDFEIQEGKGDLRKQISDLSAKWRDELPEGSVMVFDREGHGVGFFSGLVREQIPFITWERNVDKEALMAIDEECFSEGFELNGKQYRVFEEKKSYTYVSEETGVKHSFELRRIYLWNQTSQRRTCGLAWVGDKKMNTLDCAQGILSRWGASENTFKHLNNRHPFHYHPGFKLVESQRQEISNPAIKEKQTVIDKLVKELSKFYKKLIKTKVSLNNNKEPRKNSVLEKLKKAIDEKESELEKLRKEKNQLPEKIDVSTLEDYCSFKKVDNEGKNLFDFVTCSVWNARKKMIDWLQPFFKQEDELVDLFYAITDSHGWIKSTKKEVIVRLEALQQPRRRAAQEQLCRQLTSLRARIPNGKLLLIEVGETPL